MTPVRDTVLEMGPGCVSRSRATGPKGRDFYDKPDGERLHLEDWIEAIRAGKQPSTPVAAGVSAASAAHLANQALRGNGVAVWKT